MGFPGGSGIGKEAAYNLGRPIPWVGKITQEKEMAIHSILVLVDP